MTLLEQCKHQEGVRRGADYVLMRWPSALKQAWQKRIPRLSFCLQGVFYFNMKGKKLSLNRVWKQPRVTGGYGWLICAVLCQRNMLWRSEDNLDCPFLLFHLFDAGSLVVCYWNNKLSALWASWISLVSHSHTTIKTLELETASITAGFLWLLRMQTWVFMFMWQVKYPLHHLPSYLTIN